MKTMNPADILHREKCSCVILNNGTVTLCHERGVKDLYRLLKTESSILSGAEIADKVIGKGAAALMIAGGVKSVYADVISSSALQLLSLAGVTAEYDTCVPNIINRAGTGICPVETLCKDCGTAEECIPLIENFIASMQTDTQSR